MAKKMEKGESDEIWRMILHDRKDAGKHACERKLTPNLETPGRASGPI